MSTHIGANKGDIAECVLMPGDPRRAEWAATTFLENPVCHNEVRGMQGYTGTWHGQRISIQGSGMGMPSMAIYLNELISDFGVRTVIRIGSCGGMASQVKMRDIVIASAASTDSAMNRHTFKEIDFAPSADWSLLQAAVAAATERGARFHVGGIFSSDSFYTHGHDPIAPLTEHGVLAVEMEAAALYTIAARKKARALAICTVCDHLVTGEELDATARERSFSEMLEIALMTAAASREKP